MPTSQTEDIDALRRRLASVEADVALLKQQLRHPLAPPNGRWWEGRAGGFAGDAGFEEMVRLGREWREADRQRAQKEADDNTGANGGAR